MYASPRRALDVKGIGPLSFDGSRLDSGACFHTEAHERSALLEIVSAANEKKGDEQAWIVWTYSVLCNSSFGRAVD